MNKAVAFRGAHYPGNVVRVLTTSDPANPSRSITTRKKYDLITGLVIERVSGHGKFDNTGEDYITLSGQFAPGSTARITASAQNMQPVRDLVDPIVDKSNRALPLKEPITVEAVVSPMRGFGFAVQELYLVQEDGSRKTIIGPLQGSTEKSSDESFL